MTAVEQPAAPAVDAELPLVIQASLLERVLEDASLHGQTLSEWFRNAANRHLSDARARALLKRDRDDSWRELMASLEEEHGPLTDEELAAAAREWPEDMVAAETHPPAPMKALSVLLGLPQAEEVERLAAAKGETVAAWIAHACRDRAERLTQAPNGRDTGGTQPQWRA